MKTIRISSFLFLTIIFCSCDPARVYETNVKLDNQSWMMDDSLSYTFTIPDTTISYNLLYAVRYTKEYPFYNLYIKHSLRDSTGKVLNADLKNMDLFDPKKGLPYGSGMGDAYDYRILFLQNYEFPYAGSFTLTAKQYMREEPLKGIEAFGLRVEKAASPD